MKWNESSQLTNQAPFNLLPESIVEKQSAPFVQVGRGPITAGYNGELSHCATPIESRSSWVWPEKLMVGLP